MKRIVGISLFVFWAVTVAILVAGLVFNQNNAPDISVADPNLTSTPEATPEATPGITVTPVPSPSSSPGMAFSPTPKPTLAPTPKPTLAPTPAPTAVPMITLDIAEIAKHNSAADCWMIIGSKVYSLASYLNAHPGGSAIIKMYCGKDGTAAYTALPHSPYASSLLPSYFLGNLNQKIKAK